MGILDLNPEDYIIRPPSFNKSNQSIGKDAPPAKSAPVRVNPNAGGYDSSYSASYLLRNFLPDFDPKKADLDFFSDILQPAADAPARDLSTRPSLNWPGVAAVRDREEQERNAAKRDEQARRHGRRPSDQQYSPVIPPPVSHQEDGRRVPAAVQHGHLQGQSTHAPDSYTAEPVPSDYDGRFQDHRAMPLPYPQSNFEHQAPYNGYRSDVSQHERSYSNSSKRKFDQESDPEAARHRRRAEIVARCRHEDDLLARDPHDADALARRALLIEQLRIEDEQAHNARLRRPGAVPSPISPSTSMHADMPMSRPRPPPVPRGTVTHGFVPPPPGSGHFPGPPPASYGGQQHTSTRPSSQTAAPLVLDPRDPRARRLSSGHERPAQYATSSPVDISATGSNGTQVQQRKKFNKTRFFFLQATPGEAEKIKREGTCILEHSNASKLLAEAFEQSKVFLILRGHEPGQVLGYAQMEGGLGQGLKPSWFTETHHAKGAAFCPVNFQRPNLFWSEDAKNWMQGIVQHGPDAIGLDEMAFEEGSRMMNLIKASRPGSNNVVTCGPAQNDENDAAPALPLPKQTDSVADSQSAPEQMNGQRNAEQETTMQEEAQTPEVPQPAAEVIAST